MQQARYRARAANDEGDMNMIALKPMTARDLRRVLADVPDDHVVTVHLDPTTNRADEPFDITAVQVITGYQQSPSNFGFGLSINRRDRV
jgi:hypothetical protein